MMAHRLPGYKHTRLQYELKSPVGRQTRGQLGPNLARRRSLRHRNDSGRSGNRVYFLRPGWAVGMPASDPDVWSGRASQEGSSSWLSGLAQMYPASDWSSLLRAIMDISARAISLADRPRVDHQGHQCSQAPGRPTSISLFPLADLGGVPLS